MIVRMVTPGPLAFWVRIINAVKCGHRVFVVCHARHEEVGEYVDHKDKKRMHDLHGTAFARSALLSNKLLY